MKCLICQSNELAISYSGKIRSGSFGNMSESNYDVLNCSSCNVKFLNKFLDQDFYTSVDYRNAYNDSSSVDSYHEIHDRIETDKISRIGLENFRNKIVADFGTGGGTFLDVVNAVAKKTIAVEPATFFHKNLMTRHKVFSYGHELVKSQDSLDLATSFDVIEHVEDPINFLKDIYLSLNDNGVLYLMTPNSNEILNDFSMEEFSNFNYRTAHYFYFCEKSIGKLLDLAGFSEYKISFHHKYDISNLIFWLKDKTPTGVSKYDLFDEDFNSYYEKFLIKTGKASHLWIEAKK